MAYIGTCLSNDSSETSPDSKSTFIRSIGTFFQKLAQGQLKEGRDTRQPVPPPTGPACTYTVPSLEACLLAGLGLFIRVPE